MEREPFGFFPGASHPTVTHDARRGGDDPFDTGPGHTLTIEPPIGVTTPHVRLSRRTVALPVPGDLAAFDLGRPLVEVDRLPDPRCRWRAPTARACGACGAQPDQ